MANEDSNRLSLTWDPASGSSIKPLPVGERGMSLETPTASGIQPLPTIEREVLSDLESFPLPVHETLSEESYPRDPVFISSMFTESAVYDIQQEEAIRARLQMEIQALKKEKDILEKQLEEKLTEINEQQEAQEVEKQTVRIPGIDELAKTSVRVTSEEQIFVWKGYGLKLHIPQGSLPAGHTHCCIKIRVAVSSQFQFPEDSRPVSAVYWLSSDLEEDFSQHLTLEIQHCARPSAMGELGVVTATTTSHSLPFQFQRLKGGVFNQSSFYGSIHLSHFSLLSIIWDSLLSLFSNPPLTYYSRVYYTEKKSWRCEAHVVITQNLECHIQKLREYYTLKFQAVEHQLNEMTKQLIKGPGTPVEFLTDKISLDLPGDALNKEGWKKDGWKINAMNVPEIRQKMVDDFTLKTTLHTFHLKVQWDREGAVQDTLILTLPLKGAKKPYNYLKLECGEKGNSLDLHAHQEYLSSGQMWISVKNVTAVVFLSTCYSQSEYRCSTSGGQIHGQQRPALSKDGRPDLPTLEKLPHSSGHINIMQEVVPQHKQLGNVLLQSPNGVRVLGIEKSKNHCVNDVVYDIFRQCLEEDSDATWGKLVQCLKEVNLSPLAQKINSCLK